mmetsp:Transcript_12213/g.12037  ORF Transcript_12213/g.12037 Transcript_12213/m.12037 type:complete len:96 (-) Transcript_12213:31-318(-)
MVMFDLTSIDSFSLTKAFIDKLRENAFNRDIPIILVGNKLDLCQSDSSQRKVAYEAALDFAKQEQVMYMEISCKTKFNVLESITKLSQALDDQIR